MVETDTRKVMSAGELDVQGTDVFKAVFASNFPPWTATGKWEGLQQVSTGAHSVPKLSCSIASLLVSFVFSTMLWSLLNHTR